MDIDESQLPPGWERDLEIERRADGALARVVARRGAATRTLKLEPTSLVYRETRELAWPGPGGADPAEGASLALELLSGMLAEAVPALGCSFCGKPEAQVKKLFAGPGAHICDECVDLCSDILDADEAAAEA